MEGAPAPPEGLFPLGPFPRHLWIHSNTPRDSLDEVCHEIWKRVQQLPASGLHADQPGALPGGITTTFQSHNYWVDEPERLEDIYRTMIGDKEREMKLRALCDYHLSAKSAASNLLFSKSHKNSKGLEHGSATGAQSKEGSKQKVPFPPRCTVTATGDSNQAMAEKKVVKEFIKNSILSSAESGTAPPSTAAAESQMAGQKQQLPPFPEICSKSDVNAVTENPVPTTVTSDQKNVKYCPSTSGFSTTSVTTASHQPVQQNKSFPPFSTFPNRSDSPQYQGPFQPGARVQPAPPPPFGCYSRQVAPYNPPVFFQPPLTPMPNCTPLAQPAPPYQKIPPAALPGNIHNPAAMESDGIRYPFPPSYGSTPGGAAMMNPNYFYRQGYGKI